MSQIVLFSDGTVKESFAGDRVENWIQLFVQSTKSEQKTRLSSKYCRGDGEVFRLMGRPQ